MKLLPYLLCGIFLFSCGPTLKQLDKNLVPRIIQIPDQKMLVVEMKGDPNKNTATAMQTLFRAYFSLKELKIKSPVSPRARWPKGFDVAKDQWVGYYGLPVPDSVKEIPLTNTGNVVLKLEVWKYGDVAQILHVGGYDAEAPTIQKLMKFIDEQGYKIAGPHEEEYLKSRTMFSYNPKNYLTIIRYRVIKK